MEQTAKPLPDTPPGQNTSPDRNERPTSTGKPTKRRSTNANDQDDDEFEFFHKFDREKIKGVIHLITSRLKDKGMTVEYLMIPFRPEQTNEKLLKLLNQLFPLGNGQPVNKKIQQKIISKTEPYTLFQGLKYIWCRLPNSEIIGWKSYVEFKYREAENDYPQRAFLEIMPQCLESSNHASIVYDFFDLIVTLASNSKINKMSARKITKMCAVWAFGKPMTDNAASATNYDFDSVSKMAKYKKVNNSFQDGLDEWIPASDAMFHLLLAFLKSFVPNDLESAKLPRPLKSVLFNNEYPPKESTAYSSETILTIPLVTLYTDRFSRKPWQLLERCNDLFDFSDYDAFEAREDYALLKSLFKKKHNVEGISRKMSQESRRLMKSMSTKHSTFQAGWAPRKCLDNINHLQENIQVKRVDIDDYFIWTWLSTLSYEQTSEKKKLFGRSVILEFEFDGFKKWVVFQESDISLDYNGQSQLKNKESKESISDKPERVSRSPSPKKEASRISPNRERADSRTLPKVRNGTPVYESFQKESVVRKDPRVVSASSTTPGQYHTTITLDTLNNKNHGKHPKSSFDKISKWNPLHNLRKKSNSNSSSGSSNTSGRDSYPEGQRHSRGENSDGTNSRTSDQRVLSEYSVMNPKKYELPQIDTDENDFLIELPDIDPSNIEINTDNSRRSPKYKNEQYDKELPASASSKRSTMHSTSNTIEEISEMVENMITDEITNDPTFEDENNDAFKNVTKFDQYKPSAVREHGFESSIVSSVQSLNINSPNNAYPPENNYEKNSNTITHNSNERRTDRRQHDRQVDQPRMRDGPKYQEQHQTLAPQTKQSQPIYNSTSEPVVQQRISPQKGQPMQSYNQHIPPQQMEHQQPNDQPTQHQSKQPRQPSPQPRYENNNNQIPPPPPPQQQQQIPVQQGRGRQNLAVPPQQPGSNYNNGNMNNMGSPMRQNRSTSPMRNNNQQGPFVGQPPVPPQGNYNNMTGSSSPVRQRRAHSPMRQDQQGYQQQPQAQPRQQYNMMSPQQPMNGFNQQMSPQQPMNGFNQQMSPQQPMNGFNQQMSPQSFYPQSFPQQGPPNQGYASYVHAPPPNIPMQQQHGSGVKLHGNVYKKQDRKQLYDNIRSGTFGI